MSGIRASWRMLEAPERGSDVRDVGPASMPVNVLGGVALCGTSGYGIHNRPTRKWCPMFVLAQIRLKDIDGAPEDFVDLMNQVEATQEECTGWRLVYRFKDPSDSRRFWNIWQMRDEEHRHAGQAAIKSNPTLLGLMTLAGSLVESEVTHQLEQIII
jgi:hypothetical protein